VLLLLPRCINSLAILPIAQAFLFVALNMIFPVAMYMSAQLMVARGQPPCIETFDAEEAAEAARIGDVDASEVGTCWYPFDIDIICVQAALIDAHELGKSTELTQTLLSAQSPGAGRSSLTAGLLGSINSSTGGTAVARKSSPTGPQRSTRRLASGMGTPSARPSITTATSPAASAHSASANVTPLASPDLMAGPPGGAGTSEAGVFFSGDSPLVSPSSTGGTPEEIATATVSGDEIGEPLLASVGNEGHTRFCDILRPQVFHDQNFSAFLLCLGGVVAVVTFALQITSIA
jgi:hypothetical protein